jgi:hypothetical protein
VQSREDLGAFVPGFFSLLDAENFACFAG